MDKLRTNHPTVAPYLRHNHQNAEGKHPVKIRVTYKQKANYYPVMFEDKKLFLSKTEWDNIQQNSVRKLNKKIKDSIDAAEVKAKESIKKITQNNRPFTFDRFEKEYVHNDNSKGFFGYAEEYLKDLLAEDRIGTYNSYSDALTAFKKFLKGKDINPFDLTPQVLKAFEVWLKMDKPETTATGKVITRKAGKTTVGIYMRALRAFYNFAASKIPELKEYYPFQAKGSERGKYKIKAGSGSRGEALSLDQIRTFINTDVLPRSQEWVAKLFWLFSFHAQGMNFQDIAALKYANILPDMIKYIRAKTQDTEAIEEPIEVPLLDELKEIIVLLGNPDKRPDSYVFNIITPGSSKKKIDADVKQKIKTTNKWLKRLCKANGLPAVTTYWARHSYASLRYLELGDSIESISEALGHSNVNVTMAYLTRFDIKKKREANERVTAMLKVG